jgi:hypothetical protein
MGPRWASDARADIIAAERAPASFIHRRSLAKSMPFGAAITGLDGTGPVQTPNNLRI